VTFRERRVKLQGSLAMEFTFVEPTAARIDFEVEFRTYQRQNRVREGKRRIARDRIHEVSRTFLQQLGIARITALIALDELGICKGVTAMPRATL
jgi:hypothetical protein